MIYLNITHVFLLHEQQNLLEYKKLSTKYTFNCQLYKRLYSDIVLLMVDQRTSWILIDMKKQSSGEILYERKRGNKLINLWFFRFRLKDSLLNQPLSYPVPSATFIIVTPPSSGQVIYLFIFNVESHTPHLAKICLKYTIYTLYIYIQTGYIVV